MDNVAKDSISHPAKLRDDKLTAFIDTAPSSKLPKNVHAFSIKT
jgi:hypothetical protein